MFLLVVVAYPHFFSFLLVFLCYSYVPSVRVPSSVWFAISKFSGGASGRFLGAFQNVFLEVFSQVSRQNPGTTPRTPSNHPNTLPLWIPFCEPHKSDQREPDPGFWHSIGPGGDPDHSKFLRIKLIFMFYRFVSKEKHGGKLNNLKNITKALVLMV